MKLKPCLWLIMALLLVSSAFALGIRPAKTALDFEPNSEKEIRFSIVNNEKMPMTITLSAAGSLKDFIIFEKEEYSFTAEEEIKEISFRIKMPSEITPGPSSGQIIVTQNLNQEETAGTAFYANLQLEHKLTVEAPYPKKYVDVDLSFRNWPDKADIVTEVTNKGSEKIDALKTKTSIYDGDTEIKSFETETVPLEIGDFKQFYSTLERADIRDGYYKIVSLVTYDGSDLELTKVMVVGEPKVEITYLDKYFIAQQINEIRIEFENQWNEKIQNAYADILLKKDGKEIYAKKTVSFDLEPFKKKVVKDFLDATKIEKGQFELVIVIHYAGKVEEHPYTVNFMVEEEYELVQEQPTNPLLYLILAMIVVMLIVMVFLIFITLRKKKEVINIPGESLPP